jgi:hypothetical protein
MHRSSFRVTALKMSTCSWKDKAPYLPHFQKDDKAAVVRGAKCFCGRVEYEVQGNPLDAKLCHCKDCQLLHGAPFEWVTIFEKDNVRFKPTSLDHLHFYNTKLDQSWTSAKAEERNVPVKVRCSHCGTPVADEGRNMWLAYATLFGFQEAEIPAAFRHASHMFYSQRCINMMDDKIKWMGDKDTSEEWTAEMKSK